MPFTPTASPAAIGLRAHSGWAMLVAVTGSLSAPAILQRRRLQLAPSQTSSPFQPYHAARAMPLDQARVFLAQCAATAQSLALDAIQTTLDDLTRRHHHVTAACILLGSGRTTTGLAAILASHPAVHTAEGEFFRQALRSACQSCGLAVSGIKERELLALAAARFPLPPPEIERRISALGKLTGPPWTQDEKLCALAAFLLLAPQ